MIRNVNEPGLIIRRGTESNEKSKKNYAMPLRFACNRAKNSTVAETLKINIDVGMAASL